MKRLIMFALVLMTPLLGWALGTNWVQISIVLTQGQKYVTATGFSFNIPIKFPICSISCVTTSGPGSDLIYVTPITNSFTTTNFLSELSATTDVAGYVFGAVISDPEEE